MTRKTIAAQQITDAVAGLCERINYELSAATRAALAAAAAHEEASHGRMILAQLVENAALAPRARVPLCQATGVAIVFLELGQDARIAGGLLADAVNAGVRQGYAAGLLRASMVDDPLRRRNTGDNTPAIIHTDIVPGDGLRISVAAKGCGSENMSEVRMLSPSAGQAGVEAFVIDRVVRTGGSACPPVIVGIGLGNTFDGCALLAKRSLLREVGSRHPDPVYAALEEKLLKRINATGIGPMGLGGRVTALAVFIEAAACHIASLPVAVNMQCHAARHGSVTL